MWIVTITYKWYQAKSLGNTSKDAVFNIPNAKTEREAFEQAEAIFRLNEDTVDAEVLDIKTEYESETDMMARMEREGLLREDGTHKYGPSAEEWDKELSKTLRIDIELNEANGLAHDSREMPAYRIGLSIEKVIREFRLGQDRGIVTSSVGDQVGTWEIK